jgi:hypothetical protein
MGAVPEDMGALIALEERVGEEEGSGRNPVGHLIAANGREGAAAARASRVEWQQVQRADNVFELGLQFETSGQSEGTHLASGDKPALEEPPIRRYDDSLFSQGVLHQVGVVDSLLPGCVISEGTQPAGKSAAHGVAGESGGFL